MKPNEGPKDWARALDDDIQRNGAPLMVISLARDKNANLYKSIK
jgi:hypothetical protein